MRPRGGAGHSAGRSVTSSAPEPTVGAAPMSGADPMAGAIGGATSDATAAVAPAIAAADSADVPAISDATTASCTRMALLLPSALPGMLPGAVEGAVEGADSSLKLVSLHAFPTSDRPAVLEARRTLSMSSSLMCSAGRDRNRSSISTSKVLPLGRSCSSNASTSSSTALACFACSAPASYDSASRYTPRACPECEGDDFGEGRKPPLCRSPIRSWPTILSRLACEDDARLMRGCELIRSRFWRCEASRRSSVWSTRCSCSSLSICALTAGAARGGVRGAVSLVAVARGRAACGRVGDGYVGWAGLRAGRIYAGGCG